MKGFLRWHAETGGAANRRYHDCGNSSGSASHREARQSGDRLIIALRGVLRTPKVKHRAAITDPAALGSFLCAVEAFDGQPETVAALKLLPLVFTRPGELRLAKWSEFNLQKAIWTIPAIRTKMRREHQVPLPRQALVILFSLKEVRGGGRLLFPGLRSQERPISENMLNVSMRRMGLSG